MAQASVLLIEDGTTYATLASALLTAIGCAVAWASTAEDGLQRARADAPDLILIDVNLPGMDGFHAVGILRSDPRTRHIPAVALTAAPVWNERERDRAREAGFDDLVEKPIDEAAFHDLVNRFLSSREQP
jgi:two-component system cell cycle response regulator DivK